MPRLVFLLLLASVCSSTARTEEKLARITCIDLDRDQGRSGAVVVEESPLLHTAQLFAPRSSNAKGQLDDLFLLLDGVLAKAKSDRSKIVKLNIHLENPADAALIRGRLPKYFSRDHLPAVCISVGTPAAKDVLVSLDAVAISGIKEGWLPDSQGAILPNGPVCYISGQAERGKTLAEATRNTMKSLGATIAAIGCENRGVVQIKAFLDPMSEVDTVRREISAFFGKAPVPPIVCVEWTAKKSIEIEMIVSAPTSKERTTSRVEYLTPPGMTASPVFARVTRIDHGRRLYTSGIDGVGKDGTAQVRNAFAQLQVLLKKGDSDLKHLAKATYLVTDAGGTEGASAMLNKLRPSYYDPKRPPAASKAGVRSTSQAGSGLYMDFIAVCVK